MTELLDYQSTLDDQYGKVSDSKDTRSFFTHLYLYLQTIHTNQTLLDLASRGVSDVHADLYPEDAASMPNLTNGQSPNPLLISAWLTHSLTSDKGQVQLFYCWLRLFLFYGIRKHPLDKRNEYSNQQQYKLNVLIINNEFANIFKKNTDTGNHIFQESQYRLCIDVFHPWFMQCLTDNAGTVALSTASTTSEAEVSNDKIGLTINGKTLWLLVNKQPVAKVKKFDSRSNNNFKACRELLRHRDHFLDKEAMGVAAKSPVKDLPKTMGLKGELADNFVEVDTKNEKLRLLDNVEIPHEDLPNFIDIVKRNFQKNSDSSDS